MEKRSLSRVCYNIEAVIKYKGMDFKGEVENISLNGMFIKTDKEITIGEIVEIIMYLTGDTSSLSISLEGIVMRSDEKGIGLQYQKVDLDSFIHLRNIISYNIEDSDKVLDEFLQFIRKNIVK